MELENFDLVPDCTVEFRNHRCSVRVGRYPATGHILLMLMDEEGDPYGTASTTHPSSKLAHDEVLIKDYTENKGIVEPLQRAGLIGEQLRLDPFPMHKLLKCIPPIRKNQ